MGQPFQNPKEVNPFQQTMIYSTPQQYIPQAQPIQVIVVENQTRHRWLEVPGACCLAYFCGPCYMFAHLCCMIFK